MAWRLIEDNTSHYLNCNEPDKRKRLGRSGTFMAQWFMRWTLESGVRDRSPHGPLQNQCWPRCVIPYGVNGEQWVKNVLLSNISDF